MRVMGGLLLGFLVQAVGHLLLSWAGVQMFPPALLQLVPFLLGGAAFGGYARRRRLAPLVGVLPAALVVVLEVVIDPGVPAITLLWVGAGLVLNWAGAHLGARFRRPA